MNANRTTIKQLENLVNHLNKLTNSPMDYSHRDESGFHAHVGHYYLAGAYGGHKLERIVSESGGCTDVLNCGYTTKSRLYGLIHAYIAGIEARKG